MGRRATSQKKYKTIALEEQKTIEHEISNKEQTNGREQDFDIWVSEKHKDEKRTTTVIKTIRKERES